MSLRDRMFSDQQKAVKPEEMLSISVLLSRRAMIHDREMEMGNAPEDFKVMQAISSSWKQEKESIAQYQREAWEDLGSG